MILLIDDDPAVLASLALLLRQAGRQSLVARDPIEALRLLAEHDFELAIEDLNFSRETSGREGLKLLRDMRALRPRLPVIVLTAWGSIELAVEGMKAGAVDFVTKPWSNQALLATIDTALGLVRARGDNAPPSRDRDELDRVCDFGALLGREPAFVRVLDAVARVAATDASVLITGESGTGKELIAAAIHRNSRRRDAPFIKVNLGGMSPTLFESEMFGHVRGAFTDAHSDREGRFTLADRGTIFLDEIGEVALSAQVKLLRVLQDRTFEPLGASRPRLVDVRVVSATNRRLGELVSEGRFREDLFYRLNLISLHLPPLRERRDDIVLLARHFAAAAGERYRERPAAIDAAGFAWLRSRAWPGNVRELRQTIERTALLSDAQPLGVADLSAGQGLEHAPAGASELPGAGDMTLEQIERVMIEKCLSSYDGNLSRVAEALGLSRGALYRRLEKHGLK